MSYWTNLYGTVADNELHFFTISNLNYTVFVSLALMLVSLYLVCDVEHLLLNCKPGALRTEHYQLVRAVSAGAVVTVL